MEQEAHRTMSLHSPNEPAGEKDQGHCQGHIQIRVGPSQQRLCDMEPMLRLMAPADGPKTWDQAHPTAKQDENEDSREKPKGFLDQLMADDSFQKAVKALNHPFPEVLRSAGNVLRVAHRPPGKYN